MTYSCDRCEYRTEFGNTATIALHIAVSHSGRPVIEAA